MSDITLLRKKFRALFYKFPFLQESAQTPEQFIAKAMAEDSCTEEQALRDTIQFLSQVRMDRAEVELSRVQAANIVTIIEQVNGNPEVT